MDRWGRERGEPAPSWRGEQGSGSRPLSGSVLSGFERLSEGSGALGNLGVEKQRVELVSPPAVKSLQGVCWGGE